jgi:hypothetical protein
MNTFSFRKGKLKMEKIIGNKMENGFLKLNRLILHFPVKAIPFLQSPFSNCA